MRKLLEIAVFNYTSALIAANAGADRIELCKDYFSGGLTPEINELELFKKKYTTPVFVMIRPTHGNFTYNTSQIRKMCLAIENFKQAGADGFVFGCLNKSGMLDMNNLEKLVVASANYPTTFHRAIDAIVDTETAIEKLIELGVTRILTAGKQSNAFDGKEKLAEWNTFFGKKIAIMPGGGIRSHNIQSIAEVTGLNEFHSAALGLNCQTTDSDQVKNLKSALQF